MGFLNRFQVSLVLLAALAALAPVPLSAQVRETAPKADGSSSLSLVVSPLALVPVAESAELFKTGFGVSAIGELGFGGRSLFPFAGLGIAYGISPLNADDSLSLVSLEARGGIEIEPGPRIRLRAEGGAGFSYSFLNGGGSDPQPGASISGGLGLSYLLSPSLDLRASASYRFYTGLYGGAAVNLGAAWYFTGRSPRQERIQKSLPLRPELMQGAKRDAPGSGIDLLSVEVDEIFPVLKNWYDTNTVGRVKLVNRETETLQDVKVTFFAPRYMDTPKEGKTIPGLEGGKTLEVALPSLFNDKILEETESTKASAEIVLEYRMAGELYRDVRTVTLRLYDRNATRWDDDRKVAAFVTAKDTAVLAFSKNVAGLVRDKGSQAVDPALRTAMALYEALALEPYRLSYVVDPKSSFTELYKNKAAVDYLQFPRQTLAFKAGDCDDLSILYCALLESVGLDSAFVTVPGHIYAAVALEMDERSVPSNFTNSGNLIIRDGRVWVPVELTLRKEGFLRAWDDGARQWREASAKGAAALIPTRAAWKIYEPVALPGGSGDPPLPASSAIEAAFLDQAARFVDRELIPKLKIQEAEVARSGTSAARNKLGVMYARLGRLKEAADQFTRILDKEEFLPALVNLGNIQYLNKEYEAALKTYQRAAKLNPRSASALLGAARVQYEQGRYDQAASEYKKLASVDPVLAERYAYLSTGSAAAGRASASGTRREDVPWNE